MRYTLHRNVEGSDKEIYFDDTGTVGGSVFIIITRDAGMTRHNLEDARKHWGRLVDTGWRVK